MILSAYEIKNYKIMEHDPVISEVRKNREKLSARFNHDLKKLFEYLKEEQNKSKAEVTNFQSENKADKTS